MSQTITISQFDKLSSIIEVKKALKSWEKRLNSKEKKNAKVGLNG